MSKKGSGKRTWFIPDAFFPEKDNGDYVSHEAVCVLNTGDVDAEIKITLYFENREPEGGFTAVCGARRTNHIRMDKIVGEGGKKVPRDIQGVDGRPVDVNGDNRFPLRVRNGGTGNGETKQ